MKSPSKVTEGLRGQGMSVAGMSLHGSHKRPLDEAVKGKSGLSQRPQGVKDARAVRHVPRRAADKGWSHLRRSM